MHPLRIEITRGGRVESQHAVAAAIVDADGAILLAAGDIEEPYYPRSAVKAMLALPMVASGAADRFDDERALVLACASHAGEPAHVEIVRAMLRACAVGEEMLACGVHPPLSRHASADLIRAGTAPSSVHNNCSGKHAGLICLACAIGAPVEFYEQPEHPAMREAVASLERLTRTPCDDRNRAIDGCSIPTHAIGLASLAAGVARFCTGRSMGAAEAAASRRMRAAIARHPRLLAGDGRLDTVLTERFGERLFIKGGAEGVWCACLPERGLGFAVKALDGAGRAAESAISWLIGREIGAATGLDGSSVLKNWRHAPVGHVRVVTPHVAPG